MICKHCGAEIAEGSKFCTSCGKLLEELTLTDENSSLIPENNLLSVKEETPAEAEAASPTEEPIPDRQEQGTGYTPVNEDTPDFQEMVTPSEENSDSAPYFPPGASMPSSEPTPDPIPVPPPLQAGDQAYIAPTMVKKSPKRAQAGKARTVFISIIFGILIFLFTFTAESLLITRLALQNRTFSDAITRINPSETKIGKLLMSQGASEFLTEIGADTSIINEDTTVGEFLASLSKEFPMSGEDVETLLEETDIMKEVAAVAQDYETYLVTGRGGDYLSAKKLLSVIYSYKSEILRYTGVDISQYSVMLDSTIDGMKSEIKDMNAENSLGGWGRMSYILLNPVMIAAMLVLALVFTALIITNTRRPFAAMLTLGICSALSGLIYFITALFHPLIISVSLPYDDDLDVIATKLFRLSLFDDMIGISLIFIAAGAILIAVKIIQNAIVKRREK